MMCAAHRFRLYINAGDANGEYEKALEMASGGSLDFTIRVSRHSYSVFHTKKHGDIVFTPHLDRLEWTLAGRVADSITLTETSVYPHYIICDEDGDVYVILPGTINTSTYKVCDVVVYHFNIERKMVSTLCKVNMPDNNSIIGKIRMCFDDNGRVCLLVNSLCVIDRNTLRLRTVHSRYIDSAHNPQVPVMIGDVLIIYEKRCGRMSINTMDDSVIYTTPVPVKRHNTTHAAHIGGNVLLIVRQLYSELCIVELHVWKNMRDPIIYRLASLCNIWKDMIVMGVV